MNRTTSLYLDLIRPFAALIVLLSHLSYNQLSGGQLGFMASFGTQAVDIFFVLSGFVIAFVSSTKETNAKLYFISRVSRIYSVALPAIVVTLACDTIGLSIDPSIYDGPFQPVTFGVLLRCITFTNEMWNTHRFPGSDGPYWSLGFEVWYYIAFGVFLYIKSWWRWLAVFAVLAVIGPKVAIEFPIWLMGIACYAACRSNRINKQVGYVFLIVPILLLAAFESFPHSGLPAFTALSLDKNRILSIIPDYVIGILFTVHLIGFSRVSEAFAHYIERHAKTIRWISGATFSIYLIHLPILHLLAALSPFEKTSIVNLSFLVAGSIGLSLLFAEVTERRKTAWRNIVEKLYFAVEATITFMRFCYGQFIRN